VGTVAEVPRKTESLCNLVRSILRVVAFRGILTADPVAGVSVIVFTSTTKERRLVFGGGVSGVACMVRLSLAVLPPPPPPPPEVFDPLHEVRKAANAKSDTVRIVRTFMSPHDRVCAEPRQQGTHVPSMTLSP
jgi:hypothetical protein